MFRKIGIVILITLLVVLRNSLQTHAGGWAVITLDELPMEIVAGQAIEISFVVRQHGITPMEGLSPTVTVINPRTGKATVSQAISTNEIGRYSATLTFPESGEWEWSIQAFSMDQSMPTLRVLSAINNHASVSQKGLQIPFWVGLMGVAAVAVSLFLSVRKRYRWAPAILVVGILLSVAGFATAAREPDPVAAQPASATGIESTGESLFIAKGCITCHRHSGVDLPVTERPWLDVGPDLSNFSADPAYLKDWLADPQAIKPDTYMPDLNLTNEEIEALIAFLDSN